MFVGTTAGMRMGACASTSPCIQARDIRAAQRCCKHCCPGSWRALV